MENIFCDECEWGTLIFDGKVTYECDNCTSNFEKDYVDRRVALIEKLQNIGGHSHGNDWYPLAWNVKVYGNWWRNGRVNENGYPVCLSTFGTDEKQDADGVTLVETEPIGDKKYAYRCYNDPRFDEKWDQYVDDDSDELFERARGDWWSMFGDQWDFMDGFADDHVFGGNGKPNYKVYSFGRSGGWLVIRKFDGCDLYRKDSNFFNDLTLNTLERLACFADEIQTVVDGIEDYLLDQFTFFRSEKEEEWTAEWYEEDAAEEEFFGAL